MNAAVLDWNQGYQYKIVVLNMYRYRNRYECMCGLLYIQILPSAAH